ncbi:adenylate/guanylate cyclase domain-containing protein [Azotobacter chroococcum]|nr:adenylate/guanylate cyclase domain-containing protein [Azotobacter chroococcum]
MDSEAQVMAGQGELRQAAILFLDMRDFTEAAARLAPDELIALLGEYQGLLLPILKAHGGSIDKFMGDGILASFGAVSPDPAFAAQALRAVDAIWTAVGHWRVQRQAVGLPRTSAPGSPAARWCSASSVTGGGSSTR